MEWYHILLIVVGSVIFFIGFNVLIIYLFLGKVIFDIHLVRTRKSKWTRKCSSKTNKEQLLMWDEGIKWAKQYKDKTTQISITSFDGLKLVGEYIDFGANKCVIIMGGRCECLYYSYYYAMPYAKNNCNICVFDGRAHGNSEGKYNTAGVNESKDVLKFAELLHDKFNNEKILLHGICLGGASSLYAVSNDSCPSYIDKVVTDGAFTTFYETFYNHMAADNRPLHPTIELVQKQMLKKTGVDMRYGPIDCVFNMKVPVLFICGKNDLYSLPQRCIDLYDKCGSNDKNIVWMEKGLHSHLRINNLEEYDKAIADFINK